MSTEILQPQGCLIERIRVPPASCSRRRGHGNTNYNYNYNYYHQSNHHVASSRSSRKPVIRTDQRKSVFSGQPVVADAAPVLKRVSADDSRIARSSGLTMEKVTILRRGKSLDSVAATAMTCDVYAGSAFSVSPSPSALPLPSFSTKKQASSPAVVVDDTATQNLRRLLRLE